MFSRKYLFPGLCLICLLCIHVPEGSAALTRQKKVIPTQRPYIINNRTYYPIPSAEGYQESGIASWYGTDFHGRATSNGETYNMYEITAAHKVLPMNTILLVQNLENGMQTVVRVNDRGPFIQGRIIDLSYGSAKKIGLIRPGTARVKLTALGEVESRSSRGKITFKKHADFRSGEYFVQIGSFLQKYNAEKLQKKFLNANHKAVITQAQVNGKQFFRVQVYVGQTLNGARRSEKALLDKGYKGSFLIAR